MNDFKYLGYYLVQNSVGEGITFQPITHRYVGGQLRFLVIAYAGGSNNLVEFSLPSGGYKTLPEYAARHKLLARHQIWLMSIDGVKTVIGGAHMGLWYEDLGDGTGRLWTTQGMDYPQSWTGGSGHALNPAHMTSAVAVMTLNNNGTVSGAKGWWGFQGVSQRCVMWKVAKNPSWFQTAYGVGPYLYGFGGYTSLMAQGGAASIGLFAIAGPDISTYTPRTLDWRNINGTGRDWSIPATDFKIVADHRSGGSSTDWYTRPGSPRTKDRGKRATNVMNFLDGGGKNVPPNGSQPDAYMNNWFARHTPVSTGSWLSPAPDGHARWVWGDSYGSSGSWVDGSTKYGFVTVGSFAGTWAGYVNSHLGSGSSEAEIHVFDPADLGAVARGTKKAWNVQPSVMKKITSDLAAAGGGLSGHQNAGSSGTQAVPPMTRSPVVSTSGCRA